MKVAYRILLSSSFLYDLKSAWRLVPYDIMFFHSPLAAQFGCSGTWLREFQSDEAPFVAVGFDTASGNKLNDHHYYYARFLQKGRQAFQVTLLRANGIVYF